MSVVAVYLKKKSKAARDAKTLLLSAGEAERASLQAILHLVPEGGLLEGSLDAAVQIVGHAQHARTERSVVVDRLRERIRFLEDHPNPLPHLHRIDLATREVFPVVEN